MRAIVRRGYVLAATSAAIAYRLECKDLGILKYQGYITMKLPIIRTIRAMRTHLRVFIAMILLVAQVAAAMALPFLSKKDEDEEEVSSIEIEAQEVAQIEYNNLVSSLRGAQAPFIKGGYAVFIADEKSRYVGVAFEYEHFKTIHQLSTKHTYDAQGEVTSTCKFFALPLPKNMQQIRYRMVVDGLWTKDPLNTKVAFDTETEMFLSVLDIPELPLPTTEIISMDKSNNFTKVDNGTKTVRFVYRGQEKQNVRVGGTFTNWDSWIYKLEETTPGIYTLDLCLPKGTYFYSYYIGMNMIVDNTNPHKGYSDDGRVVSVITIK